MITESVRVFDENRVYEEILQAIGKTPLVRLNNIGCDLPCTMYAKVEAFNRGGSVKDKIAVNIIDEAERSRRLKPGGTVVEATSGNTGVGLAIVCAIRGYKSVFVMPDKMSKEKIQLLRAFGAKVIITPTSVPPEDPRSYYSVANRIVAQTSNAILANQYHNLENPRSHYQTTGPEIWEQTQGKVTDVVIGMGTGGTITGVGNYLKEQNPDVHIVGVDPTGSILLETWQCGEVPEDVEAIPYLVEGIGEDFLPSTLDLSVIDEVLRVTYKESLLWARCLVKEDSGSRYLSKFFDDEWMRENGFLEVQWGEVSLSQVLDTKPFPGLITVSPNDRMTDVIALFKEYNISQVPVVQSDGSLAGMVTEVDLLKHMVENGHTHTQEETIAQIMQPIPPCFPSHTPLEDVLQAIVEGSVTLVTEADRPVGILTKIDVLDFVTHDI